jgi:hypothetical protein
LKKPTQIIVVRWRGMSSSENINNYIVQFLWYKLFYSPALMDLAWPTVNRLRNDASPNTIMKVFIVLVIAPW